MVWSQIGRRRQNHIARNFEGALSLTNGYLAHSENVAKDLESFAKHAGRTTVTTDDVLLLARRNEGLEAVVREYVDREMAGKAKSRTR
jgi:hypothetical protein